MDNRDIYLRYFTDEKPHNEAEIPCESEGSLEPIETMFADISDGNLAWTIDGYSVLMNPDQAKDISITNTNSICNTEVPPLSNESLLLQLNMELPNEVPINGNNTIEITKDPIINGNDNVTGQLINNPNILKECRSLLKTSVVETAKIDDMIEEITAFNCRGCGILCRFRDEMIDHIKTNHLTQLSKTEDIVSKDVKENSNIEKPESVIFLCGICGKIGYNSQELLRQHMITMHEVEESKNISDKTSPDNTVKNGKSDRSNILRDYQLFVQHHQKSISKVRCSVSQCESRFASDELRLKHEKFHCDHPFPSKKPGDPIAVKSLRDYKYKCSECDARFVAWTSCASHLWTRHKVDIGLYSCPMCTKFKSISPHFVYTHIANTHLSSNHPTTTTKACLCNICGSRYKSLSQLRIHMERTHVAPTLPCPLVHKCATCKRVFASLQSLRKHNDQMHVKCKMYTCSMCSYQSARKDSTDRHMRCHTGEKPHKCSVCEFRAADKSALKRHEMRHAGATAYSCPHCPYTSIQSVAYKKHLLHNHPDEGGVFTCSTCTMQFIRKEAYAAHMRDHRLGLVESPSTSEEQAEGQEEEEEEDTPEEVGAEEAVEKEALPPVSVLRGPMALAQQ